MTVKSSISLSDDQHAFARTLVEAGRFPSVSAVLQQGVDLLRRQMEDEALERAALADVMAQRRSGAFVTGDEMESRLLGMMDKKRQTHALRD
jgi:antitoxin ParD1/3/4